jgi:pyruvate kinase
VTPSPSDAEERAVYEELLALRERMLDLEAEHADELRDLGPDARRSAANLLHYLALRRHDLRPLQARLARIGLSSLGRSEPHVLTNLEATLGVLARLTGQRAPEARAPLGFGEARELSARCTERLFGVPPSQHPGTHIMVTLPGQATKDPHLLRDLIAAGMGCARINCAHDDPAVWRALIAEVRQASIELGQPCRVLMDLGGPKLRTGPVTPGPRLVKWRPKRDARGCVVRPSRVWLTASEAPQPKPSGGDAILLLPGDFLAGLQQGDVLFFLDARDAKRKLEVASCEEGGVWGEARKTAYVESGCTLFMEREGSSLLGPGGLPREGVVGELPPVGGVLRLEEGDGLLLTRDLAPGIPASRDEAGRELEPARLGCTLGEAFADVRPGERVLLDDGKIAARVESVSEGALLTRVVRAAPRGGRLRADKGVNLPDSRLHLPALTVQDREDLRFVAEHADLVGLSFVNEPQDVEDLRSALAELGRPEMGIVLKIETPRAFANLPQLIVCALRHPCLGLMIARGDLAVECGFERLAEAQEEVLWLGEAAHLPVIWATQVLEGLVKEGLPSRAEITDAAMGDRAECVMLNKGDYIREGVISLGDILQRMQAHQHKTRHMLRRLRVAGQSAEEG